MQANYIMTRDVITASPNTSISELIRLMLENRVSGIPVIENGTVVGIVTEGDLLRRMEIGTERRPSHWRELLDSSSRLAADYVKMYGRKASDVMTPNVITVIEMASLAEIAGILESHRIKRAGAARGQARRHSQPSQPPPGAGKPACHGRHSRRPPHPRLCPSRVAGTTMGRLTDRVERHGVGRRRSLVGPHRLPRATSGSDRRGREHGRCAERRRPYGILD